MDSQNTAGWITLGLAFYGAALSTAIAFKQWWRERVGIDVSSDYGFRTDLVQTSPPLLYMSVRNRGSRVVYICAPEIRLSDRKLMVIADLCDVKSFPIAIQPGDCLTTHCVVDQIQHRLAECGYKDRIKIYVEFTDQLRRRFRAKPIKIVVQRSALAQNSVA